MASVVSRPNGRFEIQFKRPDGKRATIRLGKTTRGDARDFADKVERLVACALTDQLPTVHLAGWLRTLPNVTYQKLARVGLARERPNLNLAGLTQHFLEHKQGKPSTIKKHENTACNLIDFFGGDRALETITPGDADEFRTYLLTKACRQKRKEGLAPTTAQKRLRMAKKIFDTAVRKAWLAANPFEGLTIRHAPVIPGRLHFIDAETTYSLLDACTDSQFRLLLAVVRFGGLRHDSETELLRWSWIDWDADWMRFRSPKTEHIPGKSHRTIPLFAELRPYLWDAWNALPDGSSDLIFPELQVSSYATSKRLARLCRKTGIEPWPKPWTNLRSTRETEIEELFGLKCACDWIGNTEVVAKRHYLQVTQKMHARAVADGAGAKRTAPKATQKSDVRSLRATAP